MNEDKIIDLETKIAHQDYLLEELNGVVYEQQKKIDHLETTLNNLIKRLRETMDMNTEVGPANEKPPHY